MVETSAEALLLRGEVATLTGWVALLPEDVLRCRPGLTLLVTAGRLLIGQLSEAAAAIERVEPALEERQGAGGEPMPLAGELATVKALVASGFGDLATAEGWAQSALDLLPPVASFWRLMANLCLSVAYWWRGDLDAVARWSEQQRALSLASGNDLMHGVTVSTLAYVQFLKGNLRLAARTCWSVLAAGEGGILPAIAGVTATWLSEITYEWNDLEAATRFAQDAIAHGRRVGSVEQQAFALAQLAKVRQAQGDAAGAQTLMAEAVQLGAALAQVVESGYLRVKQVQLWLRQGNLAEARAWAQACDPLEAGKMYYLRVSEQLTLARVALAHGPDRALEAVALLTPLLPELEKHSQVTHLIEAGALLALAHEALGDRVTALQTLVRTLELAVPERYTRLFVDLGGVMATLLEAQRAMRSVQSGLIRQECARLLAALHSPAEGQPRPTGPDVAHASASVEPLAEPLSPREHEILRLVAAGLSNQAIAETLVIAVSTVKMHLKNIYGKLDAHSRTQAVARSQELGLLYGT
jgi:LuxR family maltose regulon positive regulatory protein